MAYIVENEVVYEVIEYDDGGSTRQIRGTVVCIELVGPDTGQIETGLNYVANFVTWQGELIADEQRKIQIEVWNEDEKLGQITVNPGEEFELAFASAGQYKLVARTEGTHTPGEKGVVINE